MFNLFAGRDRGPRGAAGWRAYAIGDVHGRVDLLKQLLESIEADLDLYSGRKSMLVFVGDLIDRGPQSCQVVEHLRTYKRDGVRTIFLLGNHEEVLLRILGGDSSLVQSWLKFGGTECLSSYGVNVQQLRRQTDEGVVTMARKAIPAAHVTFLKSFIDSCRFGDYLFVHAGIRPGVELDQQKQSDLRWIREPFLTDRTDHGFIVVHGHTIALEVDERPNRIGIDTGAYRTGVLTSLVIEGRARRTIDTRAAAEAIALPRIDLGGREH